MIVDVPTFPAVRARAEHLVDEVRAHRGFTVDPRTGTTPAAGYAVATGEGTRIEPAETFLGGQGPRAVRDFVAAHGTRLAADPRLAVGAWFDVTHRRVVLSLVRVVPDRDDALRLAVAHHQRAVHDLAAHRDIGTGG